MIKTKTFDTPDASGAAGRQFNFAIIRSDDPSQKVIGAVGVNSLIPSPSLGFGIHPDFWGRGYVSEAVAGVVKAWWQLARKDPNDSESNSESEKLFAACNKANVGSVKVLKKNRFEIYEELHLEGDTVALFQLEKPSS